MANGLQNFGEITRGMNSGQERLLKDFAETALNKKTMIKQTVYLPVSCLDNNQAFLQVQNEWMESECLVEKKEDVYVLSEEEMRELIKNACYFGIGAHYCQECGVSTVEANVKSYINEKIKSDTKPDKI